MTTYRIPLVLGAIMTLSACATTEPEAPPVYIPPQEVRTCVPLAELTRVVIPAETQTYYAITEIANPPYEPIKRTEELERIIKPEEIIYVDTAGRQITDICEEQPVTETMTPQG